MLLVYPRDQFAEGVASGKPAGITAEDVNEMNAGHAKENDSVRKKKR